MSQRAEKAKKKMVENEIISDIKLCGERERMKVVFFFSPKCFSSNIYFFHFSASHTLEKFFPLFFSFLFSFSSFKFTSEVQRRILDGEKTHKKKRKFYDKKNGRQKLCFSVDFILNVFFAFFIFFFVISNLTHPRLFKMIARKLFLLTLQRVTK